jgi:carboxypeptidase Taq
MTTSTTKETYSKLCGLLKEVSTLKGIAGLLSWDEMVMMPPGASHERGAQKAILTGVIYDKETSKVSLTPSGAVSELLNNIFPFL